MTRTSFIVGRKSTLFSHLGMVLLCLVDMATTIQSGLLDTQGSTSALVQIVLLPKYDSHYRVS